MEKKFDTTMTKTDLETFDRVKDVMMRSRGEDLARDLEALFESGVPANGYRVTSSGTAYTYLSLAHQTANHDAMEYLIRNGYKELAESGWTFSQYLWHKNVAEALLDVGHSFVEEIDDPECLFWSNAENRDAQFFRTIIQRGADLNKTVIDGDVERPMIVKFATYMTRANLVESLLSAGIDPNLRQTGGHSVLHAAVTQGSARHNNEFDNPNNVVRLENIARAVAAAGGDINMVDDAGRSAMHLACQLGYANKVRILMEAGAECQLKDKNGHTPEDLAKKAKRRDVLQIFAATRARGAIMDVVAKAAEAAAVRAPGNS